jgi:hypothetical protein
MSTDEKHSTTDPQPSRRDLSTLLEIVGRTCSAASVLDDASELIALAACSIQESTRISAETYAAIQAGRSLEKVDRTNPYAETLSDMLKGREVIP